MGPVVTVQWPKTNFWCRPRSGVKIRQFTESVIRLICLSWATWNITRVGATVSVQRPETMSNLWKLLCPIRAQKVQFYKRSGNRQCRKGHNDGDLADFGPIPTKSLFIMATSRYDIYVIMKQNFVGIGPNSGISVRVCPLYHGRSSERLIVCYWGRIRHSKFIKLPSVYDHCIRDHCTNACDISDL